jgi:hypothetical protein
MFCGVLSDRKFLISVVNPTEEAERANRRRQPAQAGQAYQTHRQFRLDQ